MSRAERYAFVQHQVLFLALYVIAIYLVATKVGVGTAIFVFGSGIVVTAAATFVGIRRKRNRAGPPSTKASEEA
jgi:hypothetical protein